LFAVAGRTRAYSLDRVIGDAQNAEPITSIERIPTVKKKRARKPEGFPEFDQLARKLIKVPKAEIDRRIERRKKKRKK
jgi:hypothetical protein